jgi:hypothetical protein
MELMQWFFMGVLFTIGVVKLKWYAWACLIVGIVAILFGIGWAGGSFLEGIAQSGAMGLMIFSGGGLILMLLTWRFLVAPKFEK